MAVKYLAGNRLWGTDAERTAMTTINYSVGTLTDIGVHSGAGTGSTAKFGSSGLDISSSGEYCNSAGSPLGHEFTKATIGGWFYPTSNHSSGTGYAFYATAYNGNTNDFFGIGFKSNGKIQGTVGKQGGTSAHCESTTSYPVNSGWVHVLLVYDGTESGTDRLKMYIDGTIEGTASATPQTSYAYETRVSIGQQGNSGQPNFVGHCDDLAIWNTALTQANVTYLNNSDTGRLANTITDGLTTYYNFDSLSQDCKFLLEQSRTTWATGAGKYAPTVPTPSSHNNNNGVALRDGSNYDNKSSLIGLEMRKIKGWFSKYGTISGGTAKFIVWSGTGSGSTRTEEATVSLGTDSELNALDGVNSQGTAIEKSLNRVLEGNDTIGLECKDGNYSGTSVAINWQYSDGSPTYPWDINEGDSEPKANTTRNRFTGGQDPNHSGGSWTGGGNMASQMRAELSVDGFKNAHAQSGNTYPNLKNGTTFLTSDTNMLYMWDGTDTWNEVS